MFPTIDYSILMEKISNKKWMPVNMNVSMPLEYRWLLYDCKVENFGENHRKSSLQR